MAALCIGNHKKTAVPHSASLFIDIIFLPHFVLLSDKNVDAAWSKTERLEREIIINELDIAK